jgi:hypothetical protein
MDANNTPPPSGANTPPLADPAPAGSPTPAAPVAPVASARPEWLPGDLWDDAAGKPKVDLGELTALKAQQAERAAQIPTDAAGYKVDLPEGAGFTVDATDPLLSEAQAWAHKEGLTQAQFTGMLALRAKMAQAEAASRAAADAAEQAAIQAEVAKLGDKAPARIDTVTGFLKGKLPAAQFEAIRAATQSAAGVEALENLMALVSGPKLPGAIAPSHATKDAAEILYGTNR